MNYITCSKAGQDSTEFPPESIFQYFFYVSFTAYLVNFIDSNV